MNDSQNNKGNGKSDGRENERSGMHWLDLKLDGVHGLNCTQEELEARIKRSVEITLAHEAEEE